MKKKFILYLLRWQLSGVVLAPVIALFQGTSPWDAQVVAATVVANLIGGAIFFWVDRLIFTHKKK